MISMSMNTSPVFKLSYLQIMKRKFFVFTFGGVPKYYMRLHYLVPKSAKAMAKISDCHMILTVYFHKTTYEMELNLSEQFPQYGLILIEAIIIIATLYDYFSM